MIRTTSYAIEESLLFSGKRFFFLGESIHGVSEYTRLRLEIAECYFYKQAILIFEADSNGMLLSHQNNEDAHSRLKNFPRILRTQETVNLLIWAMSRLIPCLGIDCIPRRVLTDFPVEWHLIRQRETDEYIKARLSPNFFEWRDNQMAKQLVNISSEHPEYRMLIMLHNLHIKRRGSQEYGELKLKSVREHLEETLPLQSHSIAQLARSGSALHNDLSSFSFHIHDPLSLEVYSDATVCTLLTESRIPDACIAWHHAFERETVPAKKQYEGCFIFKEVQSPVLV
ncbi:TraB/GumN family protein [Serratia quinivorans]|uniref:hypothetical protein n=1 Tax=Serratia quinivorans TaxID=137545 RepID=UPI00217C5E63|nr:hypothetical protein [Serratia quinivorans]CAI0843831.1 Erythromycin esterase [Serratia quinivorans]CAI1603793.1 Erythromycin esterase [Serratia quinivorans]